MIDLKILIKNKRSYHVINPITGSWSGWCNTPKIAYTKFASHNRTPRTINEFLQAKKTHNQTIVEIQIKNKCMSLEEFTKNYPEFFI